MSIWSTYCLCSRGALLFSSLFSLSPNNYHGCVSLPFTRSSDSLRLPSLIHSTPFSPTPLTQTQALSSTPLTPLIQSSHANLSLRHAFTFVRGRARQRWQPLREPRRQQHSLIKPTKADPDSHLTIRSVSKLSRGSSGGHCVLGQARDFVGSLPESYGCLWYYWRWFGCSAPVASRPSHLHHANLKY